MTRGSKQGRRARGVLARKYSRWSLWGIGGARAIASACIRLVSNTSCCCTSWHKTAGMTYSRRLSGCGLHIALVMRGWRQSSATSLVCCRRSCCTHQFWSFDSGPFCFSRSSKSAIRTCLLLVLATKKGMRAPVRFEPGAYRSRPCRYPPSCIVYSLQYRSDPCEQKPVLTLRRPPAALLAGKRELCGLIFQRWLRSIRRGD